MSNINPAHNEKIILHLFNWHYSGVTWRLAAFEGFGKMSFYFHNTGATGRKQGSEEKPGSSLKKQGGKKE